MNELESIYEKLVEKEVARRAKGKQRRAAKMAPRRNLNRKIRKPPTREELLRIIWSKASRNKSDCIEYTGCRTRLGYGKTQFGNESLVHRLVWLLTKGEIPDGIGVCHTCDNPSCINTEHLFLGNQQVNMSDASKKGRLLNRNSKPSKVTPDMVLYITTIYDAHGRRWPMGVKQLLAKKYGVCEEMIARIAHRDLKRLSRTAQTLLNTPISYPVTSLEQKQGCSVH